MTATAEKTSTGLHPEYHRGYAAGRRRGKNDRKEEQRRRERQAFLDKAYLAALPTALDVDAWANGENAADKITEMVRLAGQVAREALANRPVTFEANF